MCVVMCVAAPLHVLQLSRFLRHTQVSMAAAVKILMGFASAFCKWAMLKLQSTSTRQHLVNVYEVIRLAITRAAIQCSTFMSHTMRYIHIL